MSQAFTYISVPYDKAQAIIPILKRFSNGFDGGTDGVTTEYRVFYLRASDLILALLAAEEFIELTRPPDTLRDGKGRTD